MTDYQNLPFPKAVIFDWDNTLIDNWPAITEALNKVRGMHGLETWTVQEARQKSSRALRESFPEWFGDKWEDMRDIFYDTFNKEHLTRLQIMEGAPELLEWLQNRNIPMFIVSTKKNSLLKSEVEYLGWQKYFLSLMGSMDAPKDKPHRMPVDIALKQGGLNADNPRVWFVGDAQSDIECALHSGCTPIFVGNRQLGEQFSMKFIFSSCTDIKTALNKWKIEN